MDLTFLVREIHWGFAFLVLLCGVAVGWTSLGQRVMTAVIGIQVLLGLIFAAVLGAGIAGLGMELGEHILGALLAMGAYIAARRVGDRGSRGGQLALAALGLLLLIGTASLGVTMARGAWWHA